MSTQSRVEKSKPMPRRYTMLAARHGGWMNWPGCTVTTRIRIRELVVIMFRKWFGRSPDCYVWGVDGFMAGARDRRGNEITLEQWNFDHLYHFNSKDWPYVPPSRQLMFGGAQ